MKAANDEEFVKTFARLAQERLPDDAPRASGFAQLQAGLEAGKLRPAVPWARVAAVALAALVLLGVGSWFLRASQHISYEVDNGQVAADGKLFGGSSGSQVTFSDGSRLALSPGAQASVADLDAHGGHVRIEEGTAHVAIAKKPGAAWSLLAGPYTVRVTGTAFDIAWVTAAQRFDISMQHGSVLVTGPLTPQGLPLVGGQRLKADRELTVGRAGGPDTAAPVAPSAEPEVLAPVDPSAAPSSSAVPGRRPGSARGPSWRALVANGKFDTVLADAERRGVSNVFASASLDDLSALGDAARYAHRPDLAQRALLAQRQRFSGAAQARDAAFFLGSLNEGKAAALEWYDRYLQESPSGAYASQALGRKLMIAYGQHRTQEARQLASEYSSRYPKGPYASTARKVLAEPQGVGGAGAGKAAVP